MEAPSEQLARALSGARHLTLDTSVFLMAADERDVRSRCAAWLLDEIAAGRFRCTISAISAAELLTGSLALGVSKAVAVQTLLQRYPHLAIAPVTLSVAADAADLRVATRLPLADALIVATAVVHGVDAVVHGDAVWTIRVVRHITSTKLVDLNKVCS